MPSTRKPGTPDDALFRIKSSKDDQDDGSEPRRRITLACLRCRTRKIRCDGGYPCTKCEAAGACCEYLPVTKEENLAVREKKAQAKLNKSRPSQSSVAGSIASARSLKRKGSVKSERKRSHSPGFAGTLQLGVLPVYTPESLGYPSSEFLSSVPTAYSTPGMDYDVNDHEDFLTFDIKTPSFYQTSSNSSLATDIDSVHTSPLMGYKSPTSMNFQFNEDSQAFPSPFSASIPPPSPFYPPNNVIHSGYSTLTKSQSMPSFRQRSQSYQHESLHTPLTAMPQPSRHSSYSQASTPQAYPFPAVSTPLYGLGMYIPGAQASMPNISAAPHFQVPMAASYNASLPASPLPSPIVFQGGPIDWTSKPLRPFSGSTKPPAVAEAAPGGGSGTAAQPAPMPPARYNLTHPIQPLHAVQTVSLDQICGSGH